MAHQASCVAIGNRAILIEGAPGTGKSSLALALIDRGARLIGDDGVLLAHENRTLIARPHPRTRGLLEVRNLGLLPFDVCPMAPVALVVLLDPRAPRYRDEADECERAGAPLPLIHLAPHEAILPLRAELALRRFGLDLAAG